MNRKQKALEERYRKDKPPKSVVKPFPKAVPAFPKAVPFVRVCTLNDVLKEVRQIYKGYFLFRGYDPELWEKERDSIIETAWKNAKATYIRDPNLLPFKNDPNWQIHLEEYATKEFKRRKSKLYKALQ